MRVAPAALALAAVLSATPAAAGVRRFALVAGEPDGGAGTVHLRYAERDARRVHEILTRVGGVQRDDARLLLSQGAGAFRRALAELSQASAAARARGERTLLLVYYSGHAKDDALRLGSGRIPLEELRGALERAPADVRIGLLDSCRSGAIARTKGVRPAPAFDVRKGDDAGPTGLVLIASSAADEDSQESDTIGASWFTHHLASGLLGGADASGDGRVTLAEAYAYAYARTVGSTASSAGGVQHPVFLYDLGGAGDVVLAELAPATGGLVFPAASEGLYVVLDRSGRAVAEVAKTAGGERRIALASGRYTLKKRLPDESGLLVARIDVEGEPIGVDDARMDRVALDRDPQKGFAGRRIGLLGGARDAAVLLARRPRRPLSAGDARGRGARRPRRPRPRPRVGWGPGVRRRQRRAQDARGRPDPGPVHRGRGGRIALARLPHGPAHAVGRRADRVHVARSHVRGGAGSPEPSTSSR